MNLDKENFLKIGVLAKPHGFSGDVIIRLKSDFYGKTILPEWLFIDIEGGLVPFKVLYSKEKGEDAYIMKLDSISSDKSAQSFQNLDVYVKKEETVQSKNDIEEKERQFIDFNVFDKKHGYIGKISRVIDIQQNPLLEVLFGEKEILIPIQKEIITSINTRKKEVYINAPEGLIELFTD